MIVTIKHFQSNEYKFKVDTSKSILSRKDFTSDIFIFIKDIPNLNGYPIHAKRKAKRLFSINFLYQEETNVNERVQIDALRPSTLNKTLSTRSSRVRKNAGTFLISREYIIRQSGDFLEISRVTGRENACVIDAYQPTRSASN